MAKLSSQLGLSSLIVDESMFAADGDQCPTLSTPSENDISSPHSNVKDNNAPFDSKYDASKLNVLKRSIRERRYVIK